MEAVLAGNNQFIVAAISALITSNQATNIARIEELFRSRSVRPTGRAKLQWHLMMTGWWFFGLTAIIAFSRIVASALVDDSETHTAFINLDIGIISLMGLGGLFLTTSGFLAWRVPWLWGPWERGHHSDERGEL